MRQQYHSRLVDGKRHIWNVNKLVEQTKNLPVENVPLSSIREIDENYWFDCPDGPQPTTRRIAEHTKLIDEVDLSYPILLDSDGGVMDGMHRVCRALIEGHETIKAIRLNPTPAPDYIDVNISDLPHDDVEIL